jgi:hypothetical protein
MESIADEEYYRDFVLAVTSDPSGRHIVNIAPTPPTFRSYTILNRRGDTIFSHRDREAALQMARAHIDYLLDYAAEYGPRRRDRLATL